VKTDKKKILIVEDEPRFAVMVKLRLELMGYEVSLAGDTDSGIQKILKSDYDLFILDLMLPGGGGFNILENIQKHPSKSRVPVVILTGKTIDAAVKEKIEKYKVSALFSKPYDEVKFENEINSLLQNSNSLF